MNIPDRWPAHYYATPDSAPQLCEVDTALNYVWFFDRDCSARKDKLTGKLVRLVEVTEEAQDAR
jgi:hypothetical protein